jgi:FkbM family methyltransferase
VFNLAILSFFKLDKKNWILFWFTNSLDKVKLGNLVFSIRHKNNIEKISDLGMLFDVLFFQQYGLCKINEKDIVIDIGAHIGGFSLYASDRSKEGKIFSFEPFESTFQILKKNIETNNKKNIIAYQKAVGKKSGKTKLYVSNTNYAENSVYKKTSSFVEVDMLTLGDIFKHNNLSHCDVIKLDCEGAEYDILFSSKKELKLVNQLIMEYHDPTYFNVPNQTVDRLIKFLKEIGFSVIIKEHTPMQGILYAKRKNNL